MKAALLVIRGVGRGGVHQIQGDTCAIGRHPDCHLVVWDSKASRQHCVISQEPSTQSYFIEEPKPTRNGTLVNGERIRARTPLRSGDKVRVGDTTLQFLVGEEATDEALSALALQTTISARVTSSVRPAHKEAMAGRAHLEDAGREATPALDAMVGQSPLLRKVKDHVRRVAPTNATVLLLGETGTGKELAARAIHEESPRRDRTMACINAGALSDQLLQSELFGHKKGAFTGADEERPGWFELADAGTLFLDEVGNLSERCQEALLRVLEDHRVIRLGDTKPIKVDVRIIAATDARLAQAVEEGAFSSQLYYRLNVYAITLPPLRERREDVPLLADHFLKQFCKEYGRSLAGIAPAAMEILTGYRWPGNVRQLRHAMERAVIAADAEVIGPDDIPAEIKRPARPETIDPTSDCPDIRSPADMERAEILSALEQTRWNKTKAAEILGISRQALHKKIARLGIS